MRIKRLLLEEKNPDNIFKVNESIRNLDAVIYDYKNNSTSSGIVTFDELDQYNMYKPYLDMLSILIRDISI